MITALPILLAALAASWDWPQFRGPSGSGVAAAAGAPPPVEFAPAGPNLVWRAELPPGKSSPVIAAQGGGRIFVTGHEGEQLLTLCLDARTGRELWRARVDRPRAERRHKLNDAAAPTAVTDGRSVYVFFADFGLLAYNASSGRERWRLPLDPMPSMQGVAGSPVLAGGKLLLVVDQAQGSYMLAVNPRNGEQLWRRARKPAPGGAYSTPLVLAGGRDVVTFSPFSLDRIEVATGRPLWSAPGMPPQPKASPITGGDIIYALARSFYGDALPAIPAFDAALAQNDKNKDGVFSKDEAPEGPAEQFFGVVDRNKDGAVNSAEWAEMIEAAAPKSALMAVSASDGRELWRFHRNIPDVPSPLLCNGSIYMVQNGGIATAVDARTGELRKQARLGGALGDYYASPVASAATGGGWLIYFASQEGKITVVRDNGSGDWQQLAVNDLGEEIYATPAIVNGGLVVRTAAALYRFAEAAK